MTMYFFPSCKVQQQFPQTNRRLHTYLQERWQIKPLGCCRLNRGILQPEDTALTICNTCSHILAANKVVSIWQLIDQDADFTFPDYHGEEMTIQDCWLAANQPETQQAVRSLVRKMNIKARELPDNFAKTRFCGVKTSAETLQLAPQIGKLHEQMSAEERAAHLQQIETEKVVCYCRPCLNELNAAGHLGQHLLQLLFPGQM